MDFLNLYTNILINLITNQYFEDHRCLLIFTDTNLDYHGGLPTVRITTNNGSFDSHLVFNYFGCQGIVMFSKNVVKLFKQFEAQIRLNRDRFNTRRYLIVPKNTTDFDKFFELNQLEFVTDLLVMLPQISEGVDDRLFFKKKEIIFQLKTHKYVGTSNHTESYLVDKWFSKNQSFLLGASLYPDKFTNQLGRPLKMGFIQYEPYCATGNSVNEYHGSELNAVVQFADKYNMTPVPVINEKDYWGDLFENWTGKGILGNVLADNADIGFAGILTWEFTYRYLDMSKPSLRTGITCIVPAPKLAPRWLTPFFSYSLLLWIWIIIFFLVSIFTLSLILLYYNYYPKKYSHHLQVAVSLIMKPILLQPLKRIPVETASKFMVGLILLVSLIFTSTYSGGLATVMTIPRYENPINTVEDFARSGLDWGATQDAWVVSLKSSKNPVHIQIVNKFHAIPDEEELRQLSKTGKFAFSIERLPSGNFAIGPYIGEDVIENFRLMEGDLYWEICVLMLRKNSVILPYFDLFILRLVQAGLISKWQNMAADTFMNTKIQKAVRMSKRSHIERKVVKLNWSHIEGAFALLTIGYSVSFVVFVLEVVTWKTKY